MLLLFVKIRVLNFIGLIYKCHHELALEFLYYLFLLSVYINIIIIINFFTVGVVYLAKRSYLRPTDTKIKEKQN